MRLCVVLIRIMSRRERFKTYIGILTAFGLVVGVGMGFVVMIGEITLSDEEVYEGEGLILSSNDVESIDKFVFERSVDAGERVIVGENDTRIVMSDLDSDTEKDVYFAAQDNDKFDSSSVASVSEVDDIEPGGYLIVEDDEYGTVYYFEYVNEYEMIGWFSPLVLSTIASIVLLSGLFLLAVISEEGLFGFIKKIANLA